MKPTSYLIRLLFFIFQVLILNAKCFAQYDTASRLNFADHLFKNKDFEGALLEYKSVEGNGANELLIKERIVSCNYLQYRLDTVFNLLSVYDRLRDYKLAQVKNAILIKRGQNPYILQPENAFHQQHNVFIFGAYYLLALKLDSFNISRQKFNSLSQKDTFLQARFTNLEQLHLNYTNRRMKSAFLAGTFSALVPGAGKIYCGRPKEAIAPFLRVAVSSAIAYEGFAKNAFRSPQFYLFGAIATYFYTSNIAGAVKLAKRKNKQDEMLFKNAVSNQMDFGMQYLLLRN